MQGSGGNHRDEGIWWLIALALAALLSVLGAAGAAVTPALALEQRPWCGAQEHVHTEECYLGDVLICGRKAHTHSEACYPVRLEDNDLNTLLTRIDSTADKSLETLIRAALISAGLESGDSAGDPAETPSPTPTPAAPSPSPSPFEDGETPTVVGETMARVNAETARREGQSGLVLNENLTLQSDSGRGISESQLLQELLERSGASTQAVGDSPSTANNTVNFYIRLDGNLTCIGSGTLTASSSGRTYYYQISKTNAAKIYTDLLETKSLTSGTLQSSGYFLPYCTSSPTGTDSFDKNADTGTSTSYIAFGSSRWSTTASARYALLASRSGSSWNYTYTPIDFYTLTLDYSAMGTGQDKDTKYVEEGLTYNLPDLDDGHWEDKDGNTVTSVSLTAPTTVYAKPNVCTVTYLVGGAQYAQDGPIKPGTDRTLLALPAGYDAWRSGTDYYPGGHTLTVNRSMTLTAVRTVTATFLHLDGTVTTQQVYQGQSVTMPSGYWKDASDVSYAGGSSVTVNADCTFTETAGPPIQVTYAVNWSTPSGLTAPSTAPYVVGSTSYTVAGGSGHTASRVSQRIVKSTFSGVTSRYGAAYFTGWQTETGEIVEPGAVLTYNELLTYDKDGDGTVALTGVWDYHALQSVNFFVKYNSYNDGNTSSDQYTGVIFSTYLGGISELVAAGATQADLNDKYAITLASGSTAYLANDKLIRALYGSDTIPWLADFPTDNEIFEALKSYTGQLSVPNDAGEFVTVNAADLNEYGYAIRWYLFQLANDDGGSLYDWHVDGALVRKEGKVHTTKTFSGNETLIQQAKTGFYIVAVNEDESKHYIMTIDTADAAEQTRILTARGLTAGQITGWLTPIDDGDGDDNTLLWEFGDVKYNEGWTITEYPPDIPESADYAEWVVVDTSAVNQTTAGTGGTVTVKGVTQATDLENPEWLRAEFNNIYFRGNSLMLKKEDAATGQALAGAQFQLYQGGELMTFDYDASTGLYTFDSHGRGAITTLTCDGYTNLSTSGFAYGKGNITVREVAAPEGYASVGEITIGYTVDSDGDGVLDSEIGITSGGEHARYDRGLLAVKNTSGKHNVTVKKVWNCDESEREDVTVQLLANGSANLAAVILAADGQATSVTLNSIYDWTHTWTSLPAYANGAPVTWTVRELKIGSENCKADYTFANWIVTYRSQTTASGALTLTVENTPKRPMLYLEKRDLSGTRLLAGAEFTLVPVDADGNPISGAVTKTAVTDSSGILTFDNLRYGQRYRLTETRAPDGYLAFDDPAYLTLAEDGSVAVEAHSYVSPAGTAFHIRASDRSADILPETGGSGPIGYYAPGVMLTLTALCAAIFLKRKREEGVER